MADAREEPNQFELQALIDRNNGGMVWMRRKEEADVAFEQLGYDEEPMQLGSREEARLRFLQGGDRRRKRRGLVDGIGQLSKTLFGTATQEDISDLKESINEIIDNGEHL
ncbi:hypothetical protein CAPTEDRAFT_207184 [Capitella teleta]|uniref:Uncharacterized protein n=1 Tax=Capitella teleta TaxID=283909 RepID=R7T6Y9_CAPTE|nr:hypothetical protein CAPTEDRAFT_207184 [Capitella teleta]|eukprot:ELT89310.1 hypothetical protein CAPTEDRAFT_207184 [Capitella teleta]